MLARFSSDPASQYCNARKYARTSCAVPGMKRISRGNWRSIFICACPLAPAAPFLPPRSFFSIASAPVASCDMSNLPSRVSRVISPAAMQHSIASQASRRAVSAGSTARM